MSAAVVISIIANASDAVRGLNDAGDAADKTAGRVSKFGGALKGLAALGVAGAGVALAGMFSGALAGAEDAAKITRVLESQIANLGPAGKKAFAGASEFAEKFGNQIGVDDDEIKAVQTKLASFPDAFKAGSLGAEGMERATKAAFDLQAIGIGDAASNIVGIGKAMNDPIKGMAALAKSGVSFTTEQKAQVANFVAQGKLAEAQSVLLAGIESNAKGAAAAAASPMQRARVAVDNLVEGVVTTMLPAFDKFAGILIDKILPKVETLVENLGPKAGVALDVATVALSALFTALGNPAVQVFLAALVAVAVGMKVYAAYVAVAAAATKAWAAVQAAFNFVMALNPIGLVVIAIALLIAIIVVAYNRSEKFRQVVDGAMRGVLTAVKWLWSGAKDVFRWLGDAFVSVYETVGRTQILIVQTLTALPGKLLRIGQDTMRGLSDGIEAGLVWVRNKVKGLGALIPGWLKSVLGIKSPSTVMAALGKNVMRGLTKGVASEVPALQSTLGVVTDTIAGLSADPTITVRAAGTLGSAFTGSPITGARAAGGATYQVTVVVPPATDPAEVGRQTVKAIEAYERRTGQRRLATA